MLKHLLLIIFLFPFVSGVKGQMPEYKKSLSFSVGKLAYGSQSTLFFPKGMNNDGYSFRADYLYNCLPWLKVGVEGSFYIPDLKFGKENQYFPQSNPSQSANEIDIINSDKENLITAGVNATFLIPYKESGWRNRLRLQIGLAPVIVMYRGSRTVTHGIIENESDIRIIKGPSNQFGLSITPSLEYYIKQSSGIKLSVNTLSTTLKSDQSTEKVIIHSLDIGMFFLLSRNKKLNY